MKKVVFDTNVLISAVLVKEGISAKLIKHSEPFEVVTSEEILTELLEKLQLPRIKDKYKFSDALIGEYISTLRKDSTVVSVFTQVSVVRDTNDNMVLACAIDGKADYLVTGDKDLLDIGTYQGVIIISPAEFLQILQHEHVEST